MEIRGGKMTAEQAPPKKRDDLALVIECFDRLQKAARDHARRESG
jgi:hypothetical protein